MIELIKDCNRLLILPCVEEVMKTREIMESDHYQDWFPEWNYIEIIKEVLSAYLGNGWEILEPSITGDLTSGLLITDGEKVWWDEDYMVRDMLDIVLNQGRGYELVYIREMTSEQSKYRDEAIA